MANVQNVTMRSMDVSWGGTDLGYLDGEIEVTMEETVYDITTHQTGTQVIGNIRTGMNVEVTLTLKESDITKLKLMLGDSGGTHTPGGPGTEVFGWGTGKQFTSTFADAKRLNFHPHGLDSTDESKDWNFWKAYPMLESLTFSGEEAQLIPVTFKVYLDSTKPAGVNIFAVGDGSQTGLTDAV